MRRKERGPFLVLRRAGEPGLRACIQKSRRMIKLNRKRWLCVLLAALIAVTLLPAAAFAAGGVTVTVGGTPLNEGANSIGGGTATLDSAAGTLTLENVAVNGYVKIETSGAFTVIVKGQNSVTSDGQTPPCSHSVCLH